MDPKQTPPAQVVPPQVQTAAIPVSAAAKNPTRTPRSIIVFLLLVLPPLAWFFMWIDKTYHHWFAKMLIVSGLLSLVFLAFFYFTVGVQTTQLYNALGMKNMDAEQMIRFSMLGGAAAALLQIVLGVFIHYYLQHHGALTKPLLLLTVVLLSVSLAIAVLPPLMTIQTIYSALYAF